MLDQITPLLLTYNESPNIQRILNKLDWAREIVVVDSFSDDDTPTILGNYPTVRMFQRRFDNHANQWNYGLHETGVNTPWILAMDADYLLSDLLIEELRTLKPTSEQDGFRIQFRYCVFGNPLRGSLYPPVIALYRTDRSHYCQDGHTQRIQVEGAVGNLSSFIFHDDRKPLHHWLQAQDRYMRIEADFISRRSWRDLAWPDRLRKTLILSPFFVFFYCLFIKGLIMDGRHGLFYTLQRMLAEALLSLHLLQITLADDKPNNEPSPGAVSKERE